MTFGSADMEAGGGGERRHGQQEEQSSDERRARFAEDWGCCACACAGLFLGPNPMVARYMYALIFLVTNLLAWTLRDYGDSALAELQRAYTTHSS
jgi:serine incorporator 1/3